MCIVKTMALPKTIYDSILPISRVAKVFALHPIKFNSYLGRYEITRKDVLYALFFGVTTSMISYYSQFAAVHKLSEESQDDNNDEEKPMSEASAWFDIYSSIFIQVSAVVFNNINAFSLIRIITSMVAVDTIFEKKLGQRIPHLKSRKFCRIGMILIFLEYTTTLLPEMFYYYENWKTRIYLAISYFPIVTNGIVKLQFVFLLHLVKVRFRCINKILRKIYKEIESSKPKMKDEDKENIIRCLHSIFQELFKVCEKINFVFGFQILLITSSDFNIILNELFSLYNTTQTFEENYLEIYFSLQWAIMQLLELVLIVYYCTETQEEANKTVYHTQSLQQVSNCYKLDTTIRLFSLNQIHKTIQFSACGLYKLDYPLLLTMLAAGSSYLVILIQYDQAMPPKTNN